MQQRKNKSQVKFFSFASLFLHHTDNRKNNTKKETILGWEENITDK